MALADTVVETAETKEVANVADIVVAVVDIRAVVMADIIRTK